MTKITAAIAALCLAAAPLAAASPAFAQPAPAPPVGNTATPADYVLITVLMRHDQSMSLDQINKKQEDQQFFARIPPAGVDIVSWHVAMGIGYLVVFKVPPAKLRDFNRSIEQGAWGAFKTEFYPTYDLTDVMRTRIAAAQKK